MRGLMKISFAAFVLCLLTINVATATLTVTLYASSYGPASDGLDPYNFFLFTPTATEGNYTLESEAEGCIPFGYFHIIQLGDINPKIKALVPSTYVVTYRGIANVSDLAKFCVLAAVLNDTMIYDWKEELCPEMEYWEAAGIEAKYMSEECQAYSGLIQDSNQSLTGTATLTERVPVDPTDWIVVQWGVNKTDDTYLHVDLWLDSQHSPVYPTKIDGIEYEVELWSGVVGTIWYILLPILFVIGLSIYFIKSERKPSINEIITIAVAFFVVTILVPIALNSLYGA